MEGDRSENSAELSWEEDPFVGIIPRSVSQLFTVLNSLNCCEYSVKISFMELYNEELSDLLSDTSDNEKLRIFEDTQRKGSVVIPGLEEIVVQNKSEVYKILQKGAEKRQKASTLMNSNSSRSHSIFTITVFIKEKTIDGEETIKVGKLNLVDLAGSENIERSGATGKRAAEAGKINKSLTTLGRVITSLVEHRDHIPYRESNLTRLLQDSLGGKTKTTIIATISPAQCNIEETLSTLDYAYKAKSIKNKPEVNQKLVKKALIKEYTEEIERLKRELYSAREKNGVYLPPDLHQNMVNNIEMQKDEIRELLLKISYLEDEKEKLEELFKETRDELQDKTAQLIDTKKNLKTVSTKLDFTEQKLNENKYLLKEHVNTETNLFGQADQLLSTAKITISDCIQLHDKIERKSKVENNNKWQTTQYFDNIVTRNETFLAKKNELHAANMEREKSVEINLNGVSKRLTENKDENICSLSIFHDQQENWSKEQCKFINDECMSNCFKHKESMSELNGVSLKTHLELLQSFTENLKQNFELNSKKNDDASEFVNVIEKSLRNHQSKIEKEIKLCEKNLAKQLKSSTVENTEKINEVKSEINTINENYNKLNERKTDFHAALMKTLNDEHQSFNEEMLANKKRLDEQVLKLNSLEKAIVKDNDEIIADLTESVEAIGNYNNNAFDQSYLKINELNQATNDLKSNSTNIHAYCNQSIDGLKTVRKINLKLKFIFYYIFFFLKEFRK